MGKKIIVESYSKINLILNVNNKREDGFHEIETIFIPLSKPADTLEFEINELGNSISIECDLPNIPTDKRNLCWQAVELYKAYTKTSFNCKIKLKKNIPIAAGMGGGSSNAATVLKTLSENYKKLTYEELHNLAVKLGADVPFFLKPQIAYATGIGEKIETSELPVSLPTIIIAPHFPITAKWAYQNLKRFTKPGFISFKKIIELLKRKEYEEIGKLLNNNLAEAIYEKFPLISMIKEKAIECGAVGCEVTGSGPTLFAICKDEESLEEVKSKLLKSLPENIEII
jgi:4-diphosphocytidyl-2-C-methyl-D-erythritol kinase